MARQKDSTRAADLLLASYQWAAEVTGGSGLALQVSLTPTPREGVWSTTVRLLHVVDGKPAGIAFQRRSEWPNAQRVDFGGHILRELMALDRDAEGWAEGVFKTQA